ncbi:MAG TPA: hypothetical protein VFQ25_00845 [Ktedonobacterales bacterium]|nr:hypothetical protein [Ktedonobacterales bacterium]
MSTRESYSVAEWETLRQAPILAGLFVMTGDRPGPLEVLRESLGIARVMTHDPPPDARNELTNALVTEARSGAPSQSDVASKAEKLAPKEARARALQGMLDAIAIVTRVSPGESLGFRRYLYHTANITAQSVKEGGFLGIGGKPISVGEAAMLADLADSLDVTPQP